MGKSVCENIVLYWINQAVITFFLKKYRFQDQTANTRTNLMLAAWSLKGHFWETQPLWKHQQDIFSWGSQHLYPEYQMHKHWQILGGKTDNLYQSSTCPSWHPNDQASPMHSIGFKRAELDCSATSSCSVATPIESILWWWTVTCQNLVWLMVWLSVYVEHELQACLHRRHDCRVTTQVLVCVSPIYNRAHLSHFQ